MNAIAPAPADLQADALIESIERQVAEQEGTPGADAAREASEIRERARIKARRQMRRAILQMRVTEHEQWQQLLAELDTAARQQAAACAQVALALAWPRLPDALARCWAATAARGRWIDAQLALARERLHAVAWVVHHPAAFDAREREDLQRRLVAQGRLDAMLQPDAALGAGLVIEADGARLDSSPMALLADRAAVESALLAALPGERRGG